MPESAENTEKATNFYDQWKEKQEEQRKKEKVVIENMFDTVTKQYADKERQDLRLEAMKVAASIKNDTTSFARTIERAEEIYQWIIKPE